MGTINSDERRFRVLVVEDNSILRNLLYVNACRGFILLLTARLSVKWLATRVNPPTFVWMFVDLGF
jgi:hypothetical protein